jgi:signal transduction histidine kinase
VSHRSIEQHQKELSTLQTLAFLLELVEALVAIQDQGEKIAEKTGQFSPAITAGTSLAQISSQILGYQYIGVFALEQPDDLLCLLGISGLTPEQERRFRAATDHTPLAAYLDATAIRKLHANQVVVLDAKQHPLAAPSVPFGARYLLVAPMVLHGQLIGLFVIAKNGTEYSDIQSVYTREETELAREIAETTTRIIERVRVLETWTKEHAGELAEQEINRRYDAFLTVVSHELRTPLTALKGNLQLALRRLATLEQLGEHLSSSIDIAQQLQYLLERALQSSDKLKRTIHFLLDVSRIQAGQFTLVKRPCNLVEVVRHAVESVRQANKNRMVLLSLPGEEVRVIADAERIDQVVTIYLANALAHSPVYHPIEVSLTIESTVARVSVRDEGPGLSPDEQARIWERFYRIPGIQAQYESNDDLGLGLYLCRAIIEYHQGQVGVQSVPGKGTVFWFTLPLAPS